MNVCYSVFLLWRGKPGEWALENESLENASNQKAYIACNGFDRYSMALLNKNPITSTDKEMNKKSCIRNQYPIKVSRRLDMNSAYYSLHNKVSVKMIADKRISAHIDYINWNGPKFGIIN